MSLKLLLTDASSALGGALEHELAKEPFTLLAPQAADLAWSDEAHIFAYLQQHRPELVINCFGWDDIDHVRGQQLLVDAAASLSKACGELNIPLIHFSSYKVFGGHTRGTHSEKDPTLPISDAGRAFVIAEQVIAERVAKHIILRLSWVIGPQGDNILTRLLTAYLAGAAVEINRRLRGAPTALSDVARVTVAIIKQISCGAENWGVMHYCTGDACTQEEFAEQLLQLLIQQQLLTAEPSLTVINTDVLDEPVSAILGCRRLRDCFGLQARSWRPALLPTVRQWLHIQTQLKEPA